MEVQVTTLVAVVVVEHAAELDLRGGRGVGGEGGVAVCGEAGVGEGGAAVWGEAGGGSGVCEGGGVRVRGREDELQGGQEGGRNVCIRIHTERAVVCNRLPPSRLPNLGS